LLTKLLTKTDRTSFGDLIGRRRSPGYLPYLLNLAHCCYSLAHLRASSQPQLRRHIYKSGKRFLCAAAMPGHAGLWAFRMGGEPIGDVNDLYHSYRWWMLHTSILPTVTIIRCWHGEALFCHEWQSKYCLVTSDEAEGAGFVKFQSARDHWMRSERLRGASY
jgi:hypothetical protein